MIRPVVHVVLSFASLAFATRVLAEPPYPASEVIAGFTLDWSTHERFAQGSDNFQLTWAADDRLYGAWGDGGGFGGTNRTGRVDLGVARIEGTPGHLRGVNIWGGHAALNPAAFGGKSWGMISIDAGLYMWVVPDVPAGKTYRNHYEYIELASSLDRGATWTKAGWRFMEAENVTIPTFLNFGRDNAGVPAYFGDYVYSYFIRPQDPAMEQQGPRGVGLVVHKPGAIYLARVRKRDLLADKSKYEFYRGLHSAGEPQWGTLAEKQPVFEDPRGVGWCLSACYNAALKRVLLCTEHDRSSQCTIGIFDAPTPWGPWSTVQYYEPAAPFGALRNGSTLPWKNNVFFTAFVTKWFEDEQFVLTFTGAGGGRDNDSFNVVRGTFQRAKR